MASTNDTFRGISGLEHFAPTMYAQQMHVQKTSAGAATFINQVTMPSIKVKPQPSTWVHMAQAKWCRENETTNLPSYNEGSIFNIQAQEKVIEAI